MPSGKLTSSTLPPVLCRLLIGHEAEKFDVPNKEGRTHRWKVFVRSPNNYPDFEDRSFIKKVVFQLHTTFDKPKRTIRNPPFELEETAYGCFHLPITIHFKNVEKTFLINYDITLPMQKKAQVQQDQFIEVTNPPSKEFINLVLKYGGKLKPTALDKMESSSTPKPIIRLNEIEEKSKKGDTSDEATTSVEREKHSKKHKKRDKTKEHKRKRESSDERHKIESKPKIKTPELEQLTEMPNLTAQVVTDVDDLFGDPPPPKKTKPVEDSSTTNNLIKISSSKRPKFFVSDKTPDEKLAVKEKKSIPIDASSSNQPKHPKIEPKVEPPPALFDFVSQMSEKFEQQVKEMSTAPEPLSPLGKLQLPKEEAFEPETRAPPKDPNKVVKDEAYWKNVKRIRSLLSQPIKRKYYNISFLHTLDVVNDNFIRDYERPIPVVSYDLNYSKLTFKKEDNRKLFERTIGNDEPQLLRLVHQKPAKTPIPPSSPTSNDALLADLFD